MKKLLAILLFVAFAGVLHAQDFPNNRKKAADIKASGEYYYGEGLNCATSDEAYAAAVSALMKNLQRERKSDALVHGLNAQTYLDYIYATFSAFVEQNTDEYILRESEGDDNEMFVCLKKSDFESAVKERGQEAVNYAKFGMKAEDKQNYGDALRFYYISLMLCYSHPDGNSLTINIEEIDKNVKLFKFLNNKIDGDEGMLNEINFIERGRETKDNTTEILFRIQSMTGGMEISNVTYRYNNGNFYETATVENGVGHVVIREENYMKPVEITVDLSYPEVQKESQAAFSMMKYLKTINKLPQFSHLKTVSRYKDKNANPNPNEVSQPQHDDCLSVMTEIERAIAAGNPESVRKYFSDEGFEMFEKVNSYGKLKLTQHPNYELYDFDDEVICRSMPICFSFKKQSFSRDIVFRFNKDSHLITSVVFRLSDVAEADIEKNTKHSMRARYTLRHFMEDYQTAFALQQIDYLDTIFSDDALIIVGHVINKTQLTDVAKLQNVQKAERVRVSKAEYIGNLKKKFDSPTTEYINIHFTDFEVTPTMSGNGELYGIQVRQYYYSNNYNDVGYLFIIVDLSNELPLIHVRTWQEGKTALDDLIKLGDFRF